MEDPSQRLIAVWEKIDGSPRNEQSAHYEELRLALIAIFVHLFRNEDDIDKHYSSGSLTKLFELTESLFAKKWPDAVCPFYGSSDKVITQCKEALGVISVCLLRVYVSPQFESLHPVVDSTLSEMFTVYSTFSNEFFLFAFKAYLITGKECLKAISCLSDCGRIAKLKDTFSLDIFGDYVNIQLASGVEVNYFYELNQYIHLIVTMFSNVSFSLHCLPEIVLCVLEEVLLSSLNLGLPNTKVCTLKAILNYWSHLSKYDSSLLKVNYELCDEIFHKLLFSLSLDDDFGLELEILIAECLSFLNRNNVFSQSNFINIALFYVSDMFESELFLKMRSRELSVALSKVLYSILCKSQMDNAISEYVVESAASTIYENLLKLNSSTCKQSFNDIHSVVVLSEFFRLLPSFRKSFATRSEAACVSEKEIKNFTSSKFYTSHSRYSKHVLEKLRLCISEARTSAYVDLVTVLTMLHRLLSTFYFIYEILSSKSCVKLFSIAIDFDIEVCIPILASFMRIVVQHQNASPLIAVVIDCLNVLLKITMVNDSKYQKELLWMSSFPWLATTKNWSDANLQQSEIYKSLALKCNDEIKIKCTNCIAHLHSNASSFRTSIFTQLFHSKEIHFKIAAFRSFNRFFFTSSHIKPSLLTDHYIPMFLTLPDDELIELVPEFSKLLLLFTNNTIVEFNEYLEILDLNLFTFSSNRNNEFNDCHFDALTSVIVSLLTKKVDDVKNVVLTEVFRNLQWLVDWKNINEICLAYFNLINYKETYVCELVVTKFGDFLAIIFDSIKKYGKAYCSIDIEEELIVSLKKINTQSLEVTRYLSLEVICSKQTGNKLLKYCIKGLCTLVFMTSLTIKNGALISIKKICQRLDISMNNLFIMFKDDLCDIMSSYILRDCEKDHSNWINYCLIYQSEFEFSSLEDFIKCVKPYFIPKLVYACSQTAETILKLIAEHFQMTLPKFLLSYHVHIIAHLLHYVTPTTSLMKHLHFYMKLTEIKNDEDLCRSHILPILHEVLLFLGENWDCAINGITFIYKLDPSFIPNLKFPTDFARYIKPVLLSILVFFNNKFQSNNSCLTEHSMVITSLTKIVSLLGKDVNYYMRQKIMATLKNSLKYEAFDELNIKAWYEYVKTLDDSANVDIILAQVVVYLQPLLKRNPAEVAEIFKFIVYDLRSVFKKCFYIFVALPQLNELREVNSEVRKLYSKLSLKTKIEQALPCLRNENIDVRYVTMQRIIYIFKTKREEIFYDLNSSQSELIYLFYQLLDSIMAQFSTDSSELKKLAIDAFCLIGCVDPIKILNLNLHDVNVLNSFNSVSDPDFRFRILDQLAKSYLAATDARVQDCCAFSIQQLLLKFDCKDGDIDSPGRELWRKFPRTVQEMFAQYHSSKYSVTISESHNLHSVKVIYGTSNLAYTHKQWLTNFTIFLIGCLSSVDNEAYDILGSCLALTKYDRELANFLLPYLVLLHVHANDRSERINLEITTVLSDAINDNHSTTYYVAASQTLFNVLDFLNSWLTSATSNTGSFRGIRSSEKSTKILRVKEFLENIPKHLLARSALICKSYTRALLNFEQYLSTKSIENSNEILDTIQQVYVHLREPDGVDGIAEIRVGSSSLQEQILLHQSSNRMTEAAACYEKSMLKTGANLTVELPGFLRCLFAQQQVRIGLELANGTLSHRPDLYSSLNEYRVEAAWKLGQWDDLKNYLSDAVVTDPFAEGFGQLMLKFHEENWTEFDAILSQMKYEQIPFLSEAAMNPASAYLRAYPHLLCLQLLQNVQLGGEVMQNGATLNLAQDFVKQLDTRMTLSQPDFNGRSSQLDVKRILLTKLTATLPEFCENEIEQCWLEMAKFSREAGYLSTCFNILLNVGDSAKAGLEQALLFSAKNEHHRALGILKRWSSVNDSAALSAKIMLQRGVCMETTAAVESNTVMRQYKEVTKVLPEWEEGHFYLASYYDKVRSSSPDLQRSLELAIQTHRCYVNALRCGNRYIYQALPRLLTLWFDIGHKNKPRDEYMNDRLSQSTSQALSAINDSMRVAIANDTIAPYQLLTAFSQIISRVCHSEQSVWQVIQKTLARLLVEYPDQVLWMSMAVSKSKDPNRKNRCKAIFDMAIKSNPSLAVLVEDSQLLAGLLCQVANKTDTGSSFSIEIYFKQLKSIFKKPNFSSILLPRQCSMRVILPDKKLPGKFFPFGDSNVHIVGFEDKVEVINSLAKPKKLSILASNGQKYSFMVKPRDDLRKDCKLMEFNNIVNKFLADDAEASSRNLHIRTYAVVPLNEECGMIEWVPNTTAFRTLLIRIYNEMNKGLKIKEIRELYPVKQAPIEHKRDVFVRRILPHYPPVFSQWFLRAFPEANAWWNARQSYCRTIAVMSVVGYILGLGDRHTENILIDAGTGDAVHVDFNCLFNKGESFEVPEVVPFRLTHNMVEAMGPTGCEGLFRRACEVTMRLMRSRIDSLISVLRPFIHDPLIEWSRSRHSESSHKDLKKNLVSEETNEKAKEHVANIESRLQGKLRSKRSRGLPLSVEGHVAHLIQEATDIDNLAQMYCGWAPYL